MSKIIETTFPARKVSQYSSHERYVRKNHPYGAKTWWARRPLTGVRALILATATDHDKDDEDLQVVERLASRLIPSPDLLERAKERIKKSFRDNPPRLIDFFSGGGGIPLEAARLGMKSHSLELNPVAVILQKALFEGKQRYLGIGKDIAVWGKTVIERAEKDLAKFFINPLKKAIGNEKPIVYFWSRTVKCPHCKFETPLSRLSYLARRNNRIVTISFDSGKGSWVIREADDRKVAQTRKNRRLHKCAYCSEPIASDYLKIEGQNKRIGEVLQAVAFSGSDYQGKHYVSSSGITHGKFPSSQQLEKSIQSLGEQVDMQVLTFPLKRWSGIVNPTVYGYLTVEQFFNKRQLLVLVTLVRELRKAHSEMISANIEKQRADSIILVLTSLVEHLADWNSAFTMWIPQNEQCGRSLAGPGIAMLWDYIEINPFASGPANLRGKLTRIVESIEAIPEFDFKIDIKQGSALKLPYPSEFFDLAVVDPPYHDSLFYSALSDCFFIWEKLILEGTVLPPGALTGLDVKYEIVASKHRHKNSIAASDKYEMMMTQALKEAHRTLKSDGLLTMIYSHKTIQGWGTIASAVRNAGFRVVKAWPLYMERRARPRAMRSDALSSVVALVMRKRTNDNEIYFTESLKEQIHREIRRHFILLHEDGWLGTDILIACVAQSIIYFTSGRNLIRRSGEPMDFKCYMEEIEHILDIIVHSETCSIVTELDIETRTYLAWRKERGEAPLTENEFQRLCESIDEKIDCEKLLEHRGIPLFERLRQNRIIALRAGERDLGALQWLSLDKLTYIDKVHLLICARIYNDHRVNQALEDFDPTEREKLIAVLTMLAGTQFTTLESRRLDPEKVEARKLLSRLAATGDSKDKTI